MHNTITFSVLRLCPIMFGQCAQCLLYLILPYSCTADDACHIVKSMKTIGTGSFALQPVWDHYTSIIPQWTPCTCMSVFTLHVECSIERTLSIYYLFQSCYVLGMAVKYVSARQPTGDDSSATGKVATQDIDFIDIVYILHVCVYI